MYPFIVPQKISDVQTFDNLTILGIRFRSTVVGPGGGSLIYQEAVGIRIWVYAKFEVSKPIDEDRNRRDLLYISWAGMGNRISEGGRDWSTENHTNDEKCS